jgi:hypothetical protein
MSTRRTMAWLLVALMVVVWAAPVMAREGEGSGRREGRRDGERREGRRDGERREGREGGGRREGGERDDSIEQGIRTVTQEHERALRKLNEITAQRLVKVARKLNQKGDKKGVVRVLKAALRFDPKNVGIRKALRSRGVRLEGDREGGERAKVRRDGKDGERGDGEHKDGEHNGRGDRDGERGQKGPRDGEVERKGVRDKGGEKEEGKKDGGDKEVENPWTD